jgi:CheY-like chemotaxis protein
MIRSALVVLELNGIRHALVRQCDPRASRLVFEPEGERHLTRHGWDARLCRIQLTALCADTHWVGRLAPRPLVLVVDDEPEVSRLFSRVLEAGGFSAIEAASAEHAWALLEQGFTPVAVLLDLWMPGLGGLGLLLKLRADPRYASLPVTIVTGDCLVDRSTRAAVAASHATIRFKPLELSSILTLTHHMMESQPPPRTSL